MIAEGLTSDDPDPIMHNLLRSDAGTGFLHEGYDPADPHRFNRDFFGWANALFSAWVLQDYAN